MASDDIDYVKKQVRLFYKIGLALVIGTIITVVAAMDVFDTGNHSVNIVIGLLIATVKASLVALVFMHLNHEKKLIYKVLIFTVILDIALFALILFAASDRAFDPNF